MKKLIFLNERKKSKEVVYTNFGGDLSIMSGLALLELIKLQREHPFLKQYEPFVCSLLKRGLDESGVSGYLVGLFNPKTQVYVVRAIEVSHLEDSPNGIIWVSEEVEGCQFDNLKSLKTWFDGMASK